MKLSKIHFCALAGLAGLIFTGFYAHAGATIGKKNKVIIYPAAGETADQLRQQGITNVDNYGSYWVVEVGDQSLTKLKATHGDRIVMANYLNRIELATGAIDTRSGEPAVPQSMRESAGQSGKRLRLLQFKGPVQPAWLDQIKAGGNVRVVSYIPNNAYIVYLDQAAETQLSGMIVPAGPIQWIGKYHPYYKVDPSLSESKTATTEVSVRVFSDGEFEQTLRAVEAYALSGIHSRQVLGSQTVVTYKVSLSDVPQIAHLPEVLSIEPVLLNVAMDEVQDLIVANCSTCTNGPFNGPSSAGYLFFLTGRGFSADPTQYPVVDIADSGLDEPDPQCADPTEPWHPSFYVLGASWEQVECCKPGDSPPETRVAYNNAGTDGTGHGTQVASILAGYDNSADEIINCFTRGTRTATNYFCVSGGGSVEAMMPDCSDVGPCITCMTNIGSTCAIITNVPNSTFGTNTDAASLLRVFPLSFFTGFQMGLGVSPFGRFGASAGSAALLDTPAAAISEISAAYLNSARISNNSWGEGLSIGSNDGVYSPVAQTYDSLVRDAVTTGTNAPGVAPLNQEMTIVFSGGDANGLGTAGGFGDVLVTPPATAKNVITVGASEGVIANSFTFLDGGLYSDGDNAEKIWPHSSFGPTRDGRFKPEILAPGSFILGARSQATYVQPDCDGCNPNSPSPATCSNPDPTAANEKVVPTITDLYNATEDPFEGSFSVKVQSGTSFSAPAVSGAAQLLWWWFQNKLVMLQPSPAMTKAYILNSAQYLSITNPITGTLDTLPSSVQGMGRLNLSTMFDGVSRVLRDETTARAIDTPLIPTNSVSQQTYFSRSGQSYEVSGLVADPTRPFRVTVSWTDAPGDPAAAKALVNDLDLEVTISNQTYKGNQFVGPTSVTGCPDPNRPCPDNINNTESVFLPAGATGTWSIVVHASDIAGNAVPNIKNASVGQDFALVVYNGTNGPFGSAAATSDTPNPAANNSCQSAASITNFPYAFTNTLTSAVYGNVHPSPSAARGGIDEFFKIPLPTPGVTFSVNAGGSAFDTVLSVWSGSCGELVEVVSTNDLLHGSQLSFTADGTNDYYIVVEPHNNGPGGQMILNVNATQTPISVTPTNLAFGNQIVGTTSAVQQVTYLNGTSVSVDILSNPTITGPNAANFVILSQNCGFNNVQTGATCFVFIAFAPTGLGTNQANLVFTDNATASPRIVPLSGVGTPMAPLVCASSTGPLFFPDQLVTTTGDVQSITITNCGSAPLNISNVVVTGSGSSDFAVTQDCLSGTPIAPGSICTISVAFAPQTAGSRQATLAVTDDAANGPTSVLLQGDGIPLTPSVCFGGNPVNFGTVFVSTTSSVQSVTITNCGRAPLLISNATFGGADPGDFVITSSNCGTVQPGATCAIGVGFAPTTTGLRTAVLNITDNTAGNPDHVSLTGIGSGINCFTTITIGPSVLPSPTVGTPYNVSLTATNAKAPATFFLAVGPMPPGLSLSSSGVISGTPTTIGQFSFAVGLTDANGCSAEALYTVFVSCPTISILPNSLPGGIEFSNYPAQTFTASGGTSPYIFTQTGGSLPAGMMLSSNGVLSGTPTSRSTTFTVTATDSNNCSASKIYTLTLVDPNNPLTVSPASLPAGVVGRSYTSAISASHGSPPYSFTNNAGSLPPGLALSGAGTLSGVPTAAGTFSFTVTATDKNTGLGSTNCTISITSIADLGVSSSMSPAPVLEGSNLTCTVTVTNLGPSPATGVTVNNSLSAGLSFVSASAGCANGVGGVNCNVGTLAAGSSVSLSYVVTSTAVGAVGATATVTANETDSNAGNNSAVAGSIVTLPFVVAPNPAAITDVDGDIVSVTLRGHGTLEVHLLEANGPIDSIVLAGTDATSALTIQVKKVRGGTGDGLVNIGSIISSGSLKSITGRAVNLTGAGIQVGGSLGSVTLHSMVHSALTVAGPIKTVNVGTFDASDITATKLTSVRLGTLANTSGSSSFGIQVQQAGGTLSVTSPRMHGKITTSSNLSSNNFHVVVQ